MRLVYPATVMPSYAFTYLLLSSNQVVSVDNTAQHSSDTTNV